MELLGIIVYKYILGYILQAFAYLLGAHAFMRKRIVPKEYVIVGSIFTFGSILIRQLPIHFGVHTILNIVLLFIICITLLRWSVYLSIKSILLVTVVLLVTEIISIVVLTSIIGHETFSRYMEMPLERAILGLPAALSFAIAILVFYIPMTRKKPQSPQGDDFGNISS